MTPRDIGRYVFETLERQPGLQPLAFAPSESDRIELDPAWLAHLMRIAGHR